MYVWGSFCLENMYSFFLVSPIYWGLLLQRMDSDTRSCPGWPIALSLSGCFPWRLRASCSSEKTSRQKSRPTTEVWQAECTPPPLKQGSKAASRGSLEVMTGRQVDCLSDPELHTAIGFGHSWVIIKHEPLLHDRLQSVSNGDVATRRSGIRMIRKSTCYTSNPSSFINLRSLFSCFPLGSTDGKAK